MDIFLLIMTIVVGVLLLIASIYILAMYCHPDDNGFGSSIWCKIIVVLGLTLSWGQLLMFPLDVSNSRGYGAGFDMEVIWEIIYYSIIGMLGFFIPTAIYFYESDEDQTFIQRMFSTMFQEIATIIAFGLTLFLSWNWLHYTEIDYQILFKQGNKTNFLAGNATVTIDAIAQYQSQLVENSILEMPVSFYVYAMGALSFLGYFFFSIFGGIGLCALPAELIRQYSQRPVYRSAKEATDKKNILKRKAEELIQIGQLIQGDEKDAKYQQGFWARRRKKGKFKKELEVFNQAVLALSEVIIHACLTELYSPIIIIKKEHEIFKLELKIQDTNPLVFIAKLIMGIIGIVISLTWWAHIFVYLVFQPFGFPFHTVLNRLFIDLEDSNLHFIAIMLLSIFCLYMLWAITVGNFKVGVRIPFLITIHPMAVNETWMNSFLFNIGIILLCSVSLCHFCTVAFSQYARFTSLDLIFSVQVKYLKFFKYFFANKVFEYIILGVSGLSALYYMGTAIRKPKVVDDIEQKKKRLKKLKDKDIELKEMFVKRK